MKNIRLEGCWQLSTEKGFTDKAGKRVDSVKVTIPGSVLSGLLDEGIIDDPFYRMNEYSANELFHEDYTFERSFEVTEGELLESVAELVCEGLDTLCDIRINDRLIASTDNMHRTYIFDVRDCLKVGTNTISIRCKSVHGFIENYEDRPGREIHNVQDGGTKGNEYLRKCHSMFGWDWGPAIPDAGIWRNIGLRFYSDGIIKDIVFHQIHTDKHVTLKCLVMADVLCDALETEIALKAPGGELVNKKIVLKRDCFDNATSEYKITEAGNSSCEIVFEIDKPKLWWPNNLGDQPLYEVSVGDVTSYRIGLRTLGISQEEDEWGAEFCFIVNGVKFFSMGADYIPEDVIYSRITRSRSYKLLSDCAKSNYNTIRVWGGGYYPPDFFYDICDELGLVVWQDFMFACNVYDVTDHFADSVYKEAVDNARRLRHHASLGLWCGNNEIESAWVGWDSFKGHDPSLKEDYVRLFEDVIPSALRSVDDTTFFWPSSPSTRGHFEDPDNENRGDVHYWKVWHGFLPFDDYKKHYFRYCSEFGFQSFPLLRTIESFTLKEDRNIFTPVMESHQKNGTANGKILSYISQYFLYPKDFDSLVYVSQLLQAVAMKTGVEHMRRNRGRCMGALYWQVNDNWPVASWASIDYYGRWKACQYMARDFYAPLAGSVLIEKREVRAWVTNETARERVMKVNIRIKDFDFNILAENTCELKVPAFSSVMVDTLSLPDSILISSDEEYIRGSEIACGKGKNGSEMIPGSRVFAEAVFVDDEGRKRTETAHFVPYKHLQLKKANIMTSMKETEDEYVYTISSDTYAPFTEILLKSGDGVFSENYFDLTGEDRVVTIKKSEIDFDGGIESGDVIVRSLQDTF